MNNKHIEATANLLGLKPEVVEGAIKQHLIKGNHQAIYEMYLTVIKTNAMKDFEITLGDIGSILNQM